MLEGDSIGDCGVSWGGRGSKETTLGFGFEFIGSFGVTTPAVKTIHIGNGVWTAKAKPVVVLAPLQRQPHKGECIGIPDWNTAIFMKSNKKGAQTTTIMKKIVSYNDMTAFAAHSASLHPNPQLSRSMEQEMGLLNMSKVAPKGTLADQLAGNTAAAAEAGVDGEDGSSLKTRISTESVDPNAPYYQAYHIEKRDDVGKFHGIHPRPLEHHELKPIVVPAELLQDPDSLILEGTMEQANNSNQGSDALIQDPAVFTTRKLVVVMVGLPARGKTHIARSLERYLSWLGYVTKLFNVGNLRREMVGAEQPAEFFNPKNAQAVAERTRIAEAVLQEMVLWLLADHAGRVGIYDATNTTKERRLKVRAALESQGIRVLFLESICTDQSIVDQNILQTKLFSPDYKHVSPEEAVADFRRRIQNYESAYEPLDASEDCSFVKNINASKQLVLNQITGYLPGKIVAYILSTSIQPRTVYLSRHGESEWNVTGQLGGDPNLTRRGRVYSIRLAEFMAMEFTDKGLDLPMIWTSQLKRTRQTVANIPQFTFSFKALNEIDAGICETMTYEEVEKKHPEIAQARKKDKLQFRYPGGESYVDVIHRLEPVILEIERTREPLLVVAHNAIIRAIYGFYMGMTQAEVPSIDIPLHTVFKLQTRAYGCDLTVYPLEVDAEYNNKTPEG